MGEVYSLRRRVPLSRRKRHSQNTILRGFRSNASTNRGDLGNEFGWLFLETVLRDFCCEIQNFPHHWHPANQERTREENWENGHRGWLSCPIGTGDSDSDNSYSRRRQPALTTRHPIRSLPWHPYKSKMNHGCYTVLWGCSARWKWAGRRLFWGTAGRLA